MNVDERAQLIEDIERSATIRRGIAEQARMSKEFDIAAAWQELTEIDASVEARIRRVRNQDGDVEVPV